MRIYYKNISDLKGKNIIRMKDKKMRSIWVIHSLCQMIEPLELKIKKLQHSTRYKQIFLMLPAIPHLFDVDVEQYNSMIP